MVSRSIESERQVLDWLATRQRAMLALLETLVNTDSGSCDKPGVDVVGAHIRRFLDDNGIASDVAEDDRFGDAITATVGHGSNRPILLMGHRDTYFQRARRHDGRSASKATVRLGRGSPT